MTPKHEREKKTILIKKSLIRIYVCFMTAIIVSYAIVFAFFIKDDYLFYYTASAAIFFLVFWLFLDSKIQIDRLVAQYLLLAPIYNLYLVIRFWEFSVVSIVWLIPLPLAAYIFFKCKVIIFYVIYTAVTIIISFLVADIVEMRLPINLLQKMKIFDASIIIINFIVISLLVYYKNKIEKLEIINEIEEKTKIPLSVSKEHKDLQMLENLFLKINNYVIESEIFKDSNLTISAVSNYHNTNSTYISKAIRNKDFQNFNHYINIHRINHAKTLLDTVDMNRVTLLYIYTESGFKSQSTFNRVFKQIEGVTPSEYIKH